MIEILKKKTLRRGGLTIASMLLAVAFVAPGSALAQAQCSQANSDPTAAQYCSNGGVHNGDNGGSKGVTGTHESGNTVPAETTVEPAPATEVQAVQESSSSSLPFTGLDVGVLAVVAVALGGAGLLLRRMTTPRDTQS